MVTTADEQLAERVRLFRSHAMTSSTWDRHRGHDPAYDVVDIGFNYRLDEPRAALGLSRLARLAESIERRRATRPRLPRAARRRRRHRAAVHRRGRRALLALRLPGAARRPRDARPLPRRAQSQRHPDDLVSGAAHVHRVPALRARGRPAARQRGRRSPLRAAAQLEHDESRPKSSIVVEAVQRGARAALALGGISRSRTDSNSSWACS